MKVSCCWRGTSVFKGGTGLELMVGLEGETGIKGTREVSMGRSGAEALLVWIGEGSLGGRILKFPWFRATVF